MSAKNTYRPYLVRLGVVAVISFVFVALFNEAVYMLQKDKSDRAPKTIQLVIPAGTAEKVAKGEGVPGIPDEMQFVIGDVLEVRNEDSADHQLGPIWVPAGTTGRLVLDTADRYQYNCSFVPSQFLGLDVRQPTTLQSRLTAIYIAGPTMTIFVFIYGLLVFPIKPRQKSAQGHA
jgi:hypothetical protein